MVLSAGLSLLQVAVPCFSTQAHPRDALESALKTFIDAFSAVQEQAADPVNSNRLLYQGAIPAMLRRLDPHSVFFDPGQFEQLKQLEKSVQKGFGTVVSVLPGRVIVLQVLANTAAARVGLMAGDEMIAINNIRLDQLDMEQLIGVLSEARQHQIQVAVRRTGSPRVLPFSLSPENVETPSVDRAFLLQPGIGYVRLASFDENTARLAKESIEKLGGSALQGLVLDLRNNPGGLVTAALETAAYFLPTGKKILSVRGRSVKGQEIDVPPGLHAYSFPVSIIVNGKSASASEIVAGALQDHDRATIIGEQTYGKGLVQSVFPMSDGTGVALTTAFYYTPSGRSIQKPLVGGTLDAATDAARPELQLEYKTDSGRQVRGGGGIMPDRIVLPEGATRFRAVVETSASITSFATEVIRRGTKVDEQFTISPALMDEFQTYLSQRQIRPGVSEFSREREWLRNRLRQEIFNQALGVEKGDEIEAQRDPQVLAAVDAVRR